MHILARQEMNVKKLHTTGCKHKACGPNMALHLVVSGPAPCFYPVAAPSSRLIVKEELHLYSPKMTFGPLKATARLMWPPSENEFDIPAVGQGK